MIKPCRALTGAALPNPLAAVLRATRAAASIMPVPAARPEMYLGIAYCVRGFERGFARAVCNLISYVYTDSVQARGRDGVSFSHAASRGRQCQPHATFHFLGGASDSWRKWCSAYSTSRAASQHADGRAWRSRSEQTRRSRTRYLNNGQRCAKTSVKRGYKVASWTCTTRHSSSYWRTRCNTAAAYSFWTGTTSRGRRST